MPSVLNIKKSSLFRPFILMAIIFGLFIVSLDSVAFAEVTEKNTKISESFLEDQYGEFKGINRYYYIDSVSDSDAEKLDNSIWEDIKDSLLGWTDVGSKFTDKVYYFLNMIVNIAFQFNIFLTKVMLIFLENGFTFDLLDSLIDELGAMIPSITGISSKGTLMGGGIFGNLMQIVTLLVAVYALYMFIVKRAFIASMGTILKTVLLLTLSFLIFSNYSSFLKTANNLSTEISGFILASPSDERVGEGSTLNQMNDILWAMFVDRPYLYLQYGEHGIDSIGRERIETLLAMKPGDDRYDYVLQNEVGGSGNSLMLNSSVGEKLAFTPFYLIINGVVSMPIFLFAILLVMLQFWFLAIAGIGPFALLIAAIPSFDGVAKRYFIELFLPLALKIFFSFFSLFLLVLSTVFYKMNFARVNDIVNFVSIGMFQFILFITIFMLRNRIKSIFTSGSQIISDLRESAGTFTNPFKKAVQTTTTAAGAVGGALVAGPQGAMMGASIGNTAGRAMTGEASAGEIAGTAARTANYAQLKSATSKENLLASLSDDKKQMVTGFLTGKGFDEDTVNDVLSAFEKNNLLDVSEDELNEQFDKMVDKAQNSELKQDVAQALTSGIKDSRADEKLESQLRTLKSSGKAAPPIPKSLTSENAVQFFHAKGMGVENHEMMSNIVNSLEKQGLNDVSLEEMSKQYDKLEEQYKSGRLNQDFQQAFVKGIVSDRNNEATQTMNTTVFGSNNPINEQTQSGPEPFHEDTVLTRDYGQSTAADTGQQMQGGSFEGQQMQSGTFESTTMQGSSQIEPERQVHTGTQGTTAGEQHKHGSHTGQMQSSPLDEQSIPNNSFEHQQFSEQQIQSAPLDTEPVQGGAFDSSQSFDNSQMEGSTMEAQEIQGGSFESQPMGGNSFESQPIQGSSMEGQQMQGSSLDSQPLHSSSFDSQEMESSSLESQEMQSGSLDSQPLQGGSLDPKQSMKRVYEDPIMNVRQNHARSVYENTQSTQNTSETQNLNDTDQSTTDSSHND